MKKIRRMRNHIVNIIFSLSIFNNIGSVSANNSESSNASGFEGFLTLFAIGLLAFMAPRLRKDAIEESK